MTHTVESGTLTIAFEEDLVSTSVKEYMETCKALVEQADGVSKVVAQIEKVKMIDSQGLNLLVGLYQECLKRNWDFQVSGASPSLKRLFDFVKMTERFGIGV